MTSDIALTAQQRLYDRLNRLIWLGRLPKAKIVLFDKKSIGHGVQGYTVHDDRFVTHPVILINTHYKYWRKVLIHEMIHVAEPELPHGEIFDAMVERYWKIAKRNKTESWSFGKARVLEERTKSSQSYWSHVADAASIQAFRRDDPDPLLSAESLPENSSLIDFKAFAKEKPERLFQLLSHLRPEFQELFAEYYILEKSQSFLAKVHGQIQTRIWQNLRIVEQAIGSLIVLGEEPSESCFRPILEQEGLEKTNFGSLAAMVALYARTQDYPLVAKTVSAPVPAIRKIFRPAIEKLLVSRNLKSAALGAFLKNLTHQASLTGSGLSKRCYARLHRMKTCRFESSSPNTSPLISYGAISALHDTPWNMLEISSDHRMEKILPLIHKYGKRLFGKRAAQIFAPVDDAGELELGYILARSVVPSAVRSLLRIRGISELAGKYDSFGELTESVLVPDADVQKMIATHTNTVTAIAKVGDWVEVLSGEVARYCGEATKVTRNNVTVKVDFPSGRGFIVDAASDAVSVLTGPITKRTFWGFKP